MARLSAYKKSPIFNINIVYNGERVSFNLAKELRINADSIDYELSTQPGYYGFCLLLHKKLLTIFEQCKLERKRVYGRLLVQSKDRKLNGRPYTDDLSKSWVESHKNYIAVSEKCIQAKDHADTIYSCIKSFEQRKDLLQSIASNRRAEK
jgi:hypothetical protein